MKAKRRKELRDSIDSLPNIILKRLRQRASPALQAYWQALQAYYEDCAAAHAAEEAARKATRDVEMRKRSYWTFLDGYAFERATAEVLRKHQFTTWSREAQAMVASISK